MTRTPTSKKDKKNQITIIKGIETNRDESKTGDEEFLLCDEDNAKILFLSGCGCGCV